MLVTPDIVGEQVLDLRGDGQSAFVGRTTDPNILPQPYVTPTDFAAQFPQPLDTQEILAMCEEITTWGVLPELGTMLQAELWRELNSLAFTSGSAYISFADGECPEEYTHDGTNTSVTLKNIGAKKTLSISDIMHSSAIAGVGGIGSILGGIPTGQGMPGGSDTASFLMTSIADVKDKEVRLAMTLVLNGWDRLLVLGNAASNSLEFTGIEEWFDQTCSGTVHRNDNEWAASGSFTAANFDRWLGEACAKPTHLFSHPMGIQELLSTYFQLGFQGSQVINFSDGGRITPGFNFAGFVNTGIGKLPVIADNNFTRTMSGATTFQTNIYALRMTHNGVPLVYKRTQIPLAFKDLVPGCTAISFQIWAKTALVIKHCCAHGVYTGNFTGRIVSTCPVIG